MEAVPPQGAITLAQALDRAVAFHQAGRAEEAADLCRSILQVRPEQAETRCLLGTIAFGQGRLEAARGLFTVVTALAPGFFEAHRNLAILEQAAGRPAAACHHHRRALALRPEDGETHLALALLHGRIGDEQEAVAWLRQGVTRAPGFLPLREVYAGFCERAAVRAFGGGDPPGAARFCEQALSLMREAPGFTETLRDLLERLVRVALLVERPALAMEFLAIKDPLDFPEVPPQAIDRFPLALLPFPAWCAAAGFRHRIWQAPAQELAQELYEALAAASPEWLRPQIDRLPTLAREPVGVALDAEIEVVQGFYVKDNYESHLLAGRRFLLREVAETVVQGSRVPLVGVTPGATAGAFRLPRPLYRTVTIDQPVLFLPSTPNYWHFLVEVLPRVMVREHVAETRPLPVLLFDVRPYHREMLQLAGLPAEQVIDARDLVGPDGARLLYRLKRAAVPSAIPYPVAYRWLRDRLLPQRSGDGPPTRRLYLSRRGSAPKHRIANDAEIAALLEDRGFETVQPERLGVLETIGLMAEAEVVVAPVGAATANQVFLPPGGHWVHLCNPDFFHPDSRWNAQMGVQIPLLGRFHHLAGRFADDPSNWPGSPPEDLLARLDIPVIIDPDALGRLLDAVLAHTGTGPG
ncbi:glycosyltransferase family 61 protein [Azospirillum palustre]|nr:glycosyltransferase family 61 protein [Azospirillum palustre]